MRNKPKNIPMFYPSKDGHIFRDTTALMFNNGGPMEQLTEFNSGGTHQENKINGIPQGMNPNGQPNLVEEGETKLNAKDYIYSNNLVVDKTIAEEFGLSKSDIGKTFADVSKKMNRPNSRRENDTIEQKATERDLSNLMEAQELFKQREVEKKMQEIQSLDPNAFAAMTQPQQPQGPPQGQEMMQDPSMMQQSMGQMNPEQMGLGMIYGGKMNYLANGGFAQQAGNFLSQTAPMLNMIPGVGQVASLAAGSIGAGLQNVGTGADFGEVAKDMAFGAAKGIPGVGQLAGIAEKGINANTIDASEIQEQERQERLMRDPLMGQIGNPAIQMANGGGLGDPPVTGTGTPTPASKFVTLTPAEEARLRAEQTKQGIPGWDDANNVVQMSATDYPEWLKGKAHGASIMPRTTPVTPSISLPEVPQVGGVRDANTGQIMQGRSNMDDQGNPFITDRQYSQPLEQFANSPEAIAQRENMANQMSANQEMIEGMTEEQKADMRARGITPMNYFKEIDQDWQPSRLPQVPQTLDMQGLTFNYGGQMNKRSNQYIEGGPLTQEEYLQQQQNPFSANYPSTYVGDQALDGNMVMMNPNTDYISNEGIDTTDELGDEGLEGEDQVMAQLKAQQEEYQRELHRSNQELADKNLNLNMNQTPLQGISQAIPAAYNIGMGLFSKPTQLNYRDYQIADDIKPWEMNINPQLRQADQTFAQGQSAARNAAPGGGAYLSNMQQMGIGRNQAYSQLYGQKENVDAQAAQQAQLQNKQIQAQNLERRMGIEDFNMKSKEAKRQMLQAGLGQLAQAGKSGQEMDLQTNYLKMIAPDFASTFKYNSTFDQVKDKLNNKGYTAEELKQLKKSQNYKSETN